MTKILRNNRHHGFTLVEMLIVIVIIGILASALIPRLSNARARAQDAARKADLEAIATTLVAAQMDKVTLPTTPGAVKSRLGNILLDAGMTSIPRDPIKNRKVTGIMTTSGIMLTITQGEYAYIPITKGGVPNAGFALMAATETPGGSNRLVGSESPYYGRIISNAYRVELINKRKCSDIVKGIFAEDHTLGEWTNGVCSYSDPGQLRYIVAY